MQLHQLKPKTKKKKKKRIGRGGKRGTYSGRGIKGQKARAGHKIRPEIRDTIKKIPKLRGYRAKTRPKKVIAVNVGELDKKFLAGEKVSPKELVKRGVIKTKGGKVSAVKLLGSGEITKSLLVAELQVSKQARDKIEKAGGKISL